MIKEKITLRETTLNRKVKAESDFLTWAKTFEGLAVAKGFDSALYPKIKPPKEYQYLEGIPEDSATNKIRNKEVKANNLAMAYSHLYMDSSKATGFLANSCDKNYLKVLAHVPRKNLQ